MTTPQLEFIKLLGSPYCGSSTVSELHLGAFLAE
eukprot:gene13250-3872_t